jgi:hypothetical protein
MHTEGPWVIFCDGEMPRELIVMPAGRPGDIAVVRSANCEADARLIRAAPELLEAAQRLSALADSIWAPMAQQEAILLHTAFGKLDFAIAQATGPRP